MAFQVLIGGDFWIISHTYTMVDIVLSCASYARFARTRVYVLLDGKHDHSARSCVFYVKTWQ